MIIEFRLNEKKVKPAYLKTLYDLIEELNCKCATYLEENYYNDKHTNKRTRVVEVYGSATMVSWLILRMQRYDHMIDQFSGNKSILFEGSSE